MRTYPIEIPRDEELTAKMTVGEYIAHFDSFGPLSESWCGEPSQYEIALFKLREAQIRLMLTAVNNDYEDISTANWKEVCEHYNAIWFPEEYYDDLM